MGTQQRLLLSYCLPFIAYAHRLTHSNGMKSHGKVDWTFWTIAALTLSQLIIILHTHCLCARQLLCQSCMTLLLLLPRAFKNRFTNAVHFWHTVCLTAGFGLFFVSLIHALQMLTHVHYVMAHWVSGLIIVAEIDLAVKFVLFIQGSLPPLYLNGFLQIVLHFGAGLTTLSVGIVQLYAPKSTLVVYGDPILALVISILATVLIIKAFKANIPYLLLAVPDGFQMETFKDDLTKTFPNVKCEHLHVYKTNHGQFDISMNVTHHRQQDGIKEIQAVQRQIRSVLARAGAHRITVQNHFEQSAKWKRCISREEECKKMLCCDHLLDAPVKNSC